MAAVWSSPDLKLVATLRPVGMIMQGMFTPDNTRIVAVDDAIGIIVYDAKNFDRIEIMEASVDTSRRIYISPDSRTLYALDTSGNIRVWDLATYTCSACIQNIPSVSDFVLSPDGSMILTMYQNGEDPQLIDAKTFQIIHTFSSSTRPASGENRVTAAAFHPDNDRIALGEASGHVEYLEILYKDGGVIYSLMGASANVADYNDLPQAIEPVDEELVAGAKKRLAQEYPAMAAIFEANGYTWASSMASASAVSTHQDGYMFLLNESLKERLTTIQSDAVSLFLYLLAVHDVIAAASTVDTNRLLAAELAAYNAYTKLTPEDKKSLRSLVESLPNAGSYTKVFDLYDTLAVNNTAQEQVINALATYLVRSVMNSVQEIVITEINKNVIAQQAQSPSQAPQSGSTRGKISKFIHKDWIINPPVNSWYDSPVRMLAFSDDGTMILAAVGEKKMVVVDELTYATLSEITSVAEPVWGVGNKIIYIDTDSKKCLYQHVPPSKTSLQIGKWFSGRTTGFAFKP